VKNYWVRFASRQKRYSPAWKDVELGDLPDNVFANAESAIFADSVAASKRGDDVPVGLLRELKRMDNAGRLISTFVGPRTFIGGMGRPPRYIKKLAPPPRTDY
jgi:hypothetical protein